MNSSAIEEFKRDFTIKTAVQEKQFEQWLKLFFFLNNELKEKYDFVYQDAFYIKLYELFTEGLVYANKILKAIDKNKNFEKHSWYLKLVEGLETIKLEIAEIEFEYIEYRRHNACHIFQDNYEIIQENLKIKKERKGKNLHVLNKELMKLISKYGSDRKLDDYLNNKLQPKLTDLYNQLT